MFKKILVPLDGSVLSEAAIPVAMDLAKCAQGGIVLLRSVDSAWDVESMSIEQMHEFRTRLSNECQRYLDAVRESIQHGGVKRLVLGSIADRVMHLAQVPVLLIRPDASTVKPYAAPASMRLTG
jgi:nucleotide-binding universal stress UspA family protein